MGFSLITATHGSQGLRLLVSKPVDAVILEYHLGLLDGVAVADEIKKVRPQLPIVMFAENLQLPDGALKSVDALVTNCDGPRFLLEAIHTLLQAKDRQDLDAGSAGQADQRGEAMPGRKKRQILVVDDDPSVLEIFATVLMSAGYDITTAKDGFGALLRLRQILPDVVVSDLDMPKMSGYELLSVIRRRFPDILTVAMSGAYQGGDVPRGVVADSFFPKGGHPKKLLETLEGLLRSVSARGSDHHRESAPAWVLRNGNDSRGMPSVMLTCTECLRAFQVTVVEETTGQVLEIPCCFCPGISRYIIQPATHGMCTVA